MQSITFTPEDKERMFDEIAKRFYNRNFGQMSKSDMELLMFHFYIETLNQQMKSNDGLIDYKKCSDYIISKDLGITQQRIRNLKVKNQLVYPPEDEEKDEWKKNFANLIKNARYDEQTKKVIISIPDPNLYLEIENFLEEKGSYIEKQLNPKLLQIRVEYYIDLIVLNEDEETRKKIRKKIKKQFNTDNKEEFDELNLGKSIIKNSVDVVSVINNISEMISPGNIIGNAVKHSLYSS